jgi:hypothetical protein
MDRQVNCRRLLRSLQAFRWWRSLRRRLSRWWAGTAELCCLVRRCVRESRGVILRAVIRRVRAVVEIAAGIVEGGDGIVAVDAMTSGDVVDAMVNGIARRKVRCGWSIVRSRAASIRRRL